MNEQVEKWIDSLNCSFKAGDTVYVYVEPNYVNDLDISLVWECNVNYITYSQKVTAYDDEPKVETSVELRLSCGFDDFSRKVENVFSNKEYALEHAKKELKNRMVKREVYGKKLESVLEMLNKNEVR